MGVVIFGAIALYLIISLVVVLLAARAAKKKGRSPWRWGGAAALVLYLLVFWDHIPTVVAHKYYCATEAGFWIHKTLEQWKAENPGVADTLTWREIPDRSDTIQLPGGATRYILNERFIWEIHRRHLPFLPTTISEELVIDQKTADILVRRISVGSSYGNLAVGSNDWRVFKFWLSLDSCIPEPKTFGFFLTEVKRMGAKK